MSISGQGEPLPSGSVFAMMGCSWSAEVFGRLVRVKWHPPEWKDPGFPCRTLHTDNTTMFCCCCCLTSPVSGFNVLTIQCINDYNTVLINKFLMLAGKLQSDMSKIIYKIFGQCCGKSKVYLMISW